jgi:hypothetical protein
MLRRDGFAHVVNKWYTRVYGNIIPTKWLAAAIADMLENGTRSRAPRVLTAAIILFVNAIDIQSAQSRAELAGPLEQCGMMADQVARLRCYEKTTFRVQYARADSVGRGTWRLVRTPNPRSGADVISIMQPAEPSRSDIALAGLMLRCSERGFDVLIAFLKPFPPRTHPKVKLTARGATVSFDATVIPPGAAISLPAEAATLVKESWQSSLELAIEVTDDSNAVRGIVSLLGLGPALSLLIANCPSQ